MYVRKEMDGQFVSWRFFSGVVIKLTFLKLVVCYLTVLDFFSLSRNLISMMLREKGMFASLEFTLQILQGLPVYA
jgi:hypothetical protein